MIVSCPECGGKVSTTASSCPHCGHASAPPVPEILEGEIVEESVPVAPVVRRARPAAPRGRRPVSRVGYTETESTGALVCGILGLVVCPILSFVAIAIGKPGKPGRILGIVGVALWVLAVFFWLVVLGGTMAMSRAT